MASKILVVTPHTAFGELIRQSLLESDGHDVTVTPHAVDAMILSQKEVFQLAIVDSDIRDGSLVEVGLMLRSGRPGLKLVVIPPNNDPNSPSLGNLKPDGFLNKPFYLPDLLEIVERLEPQSSSTELSSDLADASVNEKTSPLWATDRRIAANALAILVSDTAAHCVLMTGVNGLWAYSGGVPQSSVDEFSMTVMHYWDPEGGCDLARFVRQSSNGIEYMLYATNLGSGLVLALVYEASIPFTRIRMQAAHMVRELMAAPSSGPSLPDVWGSASNPTESAPIAHTEDELEPEDDGDLSLQEDLSVHSLEALFDNIPSPDPEPENILAAEPLEWVKEFEASSNIPAASADILPTQVEPADTGLLQPVESTAWQAVKIGLPGLGEIEGLSSDPLADTRPLDLKKKPEPVSASIEDQGISDRITYVCVLVPRTKVHLLTGKLAASLSLWLPDICRAKNWRLEGMSIRPDHLQCLVRVDARTEPEMIQREVRWATSQRIYAQYPAFRKESTTDDFWAAGHLTMLGNKMVAPLLVQDLIRQTIPQPGQA